MNKTITELIDEYEATHKCFDIRNNEERSILCVNNEDNTWSFNDHASEYLEIGKLYTVDSIDVHSWHTRVSVKEIPNMWFNSVAFEELT